MNHTAPTLNIASQHPPQASLPGAEFGRAKPIAAGLSISIATWHRWVKKRIAPPGIKISPTVTVWRMSEVRAMITSLEEEGEAA